MRHGNGVNVIHLVMSRVLMVRSIGVNSYACSAFPHPTNSPFSWLNGLVYF